MKDKLRHVGIHDLANKPVPPMLVEGIVPSKGIVEVVSAPGVGKTWMALECGLAVALGRPAFGAFQAKKGKALYIGEDSPDWDIGQQLRKMTDPKDWEEIEDNFRFCVHEGAELDTAAGLVKIANTLEDVFPEPDSDGEMHLSYGMVILDSLRTMHRGSENDSDWMAGVMRRIKELARPVSVMVLHHKGKSGAVPKDAWEESRGSGEIVAASDAVLQLTKKGELRYVHPARARGIRCVEFKWRLVEEDDVVTLKEESEYENIKEFIRDRERFSRAELLDFLTEVMTGKGEETVRSATQRTLQRLVAKGVVEKVRRGEYKVLRDSKLA